jgi:DNA polymerase/3'-5' exonuclease PolX
MENKEIARVLWETADLMEIAGEDSFRIRSYRNHDHLAAERRRWRPPRTR